MWKVNWNKILKKKLEVILVIILWGRRRCTGKSWRCRKKIQQIKQIKWSCIFIFWKNKACSIFYFSL